MVKKTDDFISQMMEETFGNAPAKTNHAVNLGQFNISKDRHFLFFSKNNTNIMIPTNWSVFNELMMNANRKSFFYTFISQHNDVNKLREIILKDADKNLLFYTSHGEIFYEEIVGANIFPTINRVLNKAA